MLQKTLLNIEGLGRELDLNSTCGQPQPFLEHSMKDQLGCAFGATKQEMSDWAWILPQMPRLLHQALNRPEPADLTPVLSALTKAQCISKKQTTCSDCTATGRVARYPHPSYPSICILSLERSRANPFRNTSVSEQYVVGKQNNQGGNPESTVSYNAWRAIFGRERPLMLTHLLQTFALLNAYQVKRWRGITFK